MENKKTKTLFRFFSILDYEKEEAFLREERLNGWKYVKFTFPGFYRFEQCEPEDVIYRLDYNSASGPDKGAYVQMFNDCGWAYEGDVFGWSYFSKSAAGADEDEEIFSDIDSKLDLFGRIFKGRMLPLVILFCSVILPFLAMFSVRWYNGENTDPWFFGVFIVYVILFVVYISIFTLYGYKLNKLKKKYGRK